MELLIVSQTLEQMEQGKGAITEADKEFVVQFAFATGDKELTGKLIDELAAKKADKEAVYRKYETLTGFQPEWIKKIEHLLIALEMYRIQEEKAINTISELLAVNGVSLTADEIRELSVDKVKEHLGKKEAMIR